MQFVLSLVCTIIPLRTAGVHEDVSVTMIDANPSRRFHIIPNYGAMPSNVDKYCGEAFAGRQIRIG
jgi:hypothetical protein